MDSSTSAAILVAMVLLVCTITLTATSAPFQMAVGVD